MKKMSLVILLFASFLTSHGTISWMGNHSTGSQPVNSQTIHFYVEMFNNYSGCHAEVTIYEGSSWVSYSMNYAGANGNNSTWTADVNVKSSSTAYYFHGWDDYGAPSVYDNNGGANYTISINPTTKSGGNGNWDNAGNWCDGSVPSSTSANFVIAHSLTLNQAVTVGSLTINSGTTFTSSDATPRTLTISRSNSATTLSNSGTWQNGSGGSTVIFTGAPSVSDAVHSISGTIAFQNIIVNKTGGSSNVGCSFGANSSVTGTLEIGAGGFISTAPPTSFYGSNAILKFNQGSGATYDVNSGDFSWSTTVIPQYITISSGTVNLNANRTATGNLLIDGGSLVLNSNTPNLTIQGNWTRSSGTFTGGTGTVTLSGASSSLVNITGGGSMYDLVISKTGSASVTMNSPLLIANNMTINIGSVFVVSSGNSLTVSGTLTNTTASALLVKSGGSLIQNSANVSATVEREISGWGDVSHGWHFLSSPVAAQAISPAFTNATPANYDFYAWYEPSNLWVNFKNTSIAPTWNTANGSTNFNVGKGYLVGYLDTDTKQFSGTLNKDAVPVSNLPISAGTNRGWHLLGNPFPSAITWGTTGWTLTNINNTAKIWKESTAAYIDIASGEAIPALNGFMVQVNATFGGNNSLTIPTNARITTATAWLKTSATPSVVLVANDPAGQTAQESVVRFDNSATAGFDTEFDAHFLAGYAPLFYSLAGDDQLSTNALPDYGGVVQIPFDFVKNGGTEFTIEAKSISNIIGPVILTDLKTNATQDLTQNPVYSFASETGDNPGRFVLNFGSVGVNETSKNNPFNIYSANNSILVSSISGKSSGIVYIYNMMGQLIQQQELSGSNLTRVNLNTPTGYYLVKVVTGEQVFSGKVFINKQ